MGHGERRARAGRVLPDRVEEPEGVRHRRRGAVVRGVPVRAGVSGAGREETRRNSAAAANGTSRELTADTPQTVEEATLAEGANRISEIERLTWPGMPRTPRIHAPGAMYHVTLRGNHRQDIFFSGKDRHLLTTIIGESWPEVRCAAARVLLHDQSHPCVLPGGRRAARQDHVAHRGPTRARPGAAADDRTSLREALSPVLVDADAYLLALLRYIHRNPVRAAWCRRLTTISGPATMPTWEDVRAMGHNRVRASHARRGSRARDSRLTQAFIAAHPRARRSTNRTSATRAFLEATLSHRGSSERTGRHGTDTALQHVVR